MVRTSSPRASSQRPVAGGKRRARGAPAQARYLARQREILAAAAAVFRERGFALAGMREIAERAGLSPANLYYYFDSKDELLFFCQDQALERMLTGLAEVRASGAPASEQLARVIEVQLRCMLDEVDGAAAHVAVDALPPELRARIVAKRDRYERALRGLVAEGVAAGEFAPCDPVLVTRAILGALNWTAQWYRPGGRTPSATVAAEFTSFLVRGVLK